MRKFGNKTLLASAVMAAMVGASSVAAGGRSDLVLAALEAGKADYVSGELLVQFREGTSEADKNAVRRGLGAARVETVRGGRGGDLELMRLPIGLSISTAVRGLDGDSAVAFAEPNWVYTHSNVTDTYFTSGQLWGAYGATSSPANPFGSGAAVNWAAKGMPNCSNVVIGIIDEGYMYTHTDLDANAFTNPGEVAGDGRDNDGNGYVDDVYGWDFDGNNAQIFDGVGDDHGTHVAGTIGAEANGAGVVGVCPNVKMMGAKFLGSRGGTSANAIKAVDYFTDMKTRHNLNLVATNNSWGGGGFSQALQDAIERANTAGILFIAAAGNSATDNDATASYPSGYPNSNIIAVASITNTGALSSFSQYGRTSVDIGAPGSGIWSTVPTQSRKNAPVTSGYASYNGTSMATPHVSGAAALYAARNPGATATQIKAAILNSATPTTSLNGKVATNGRLNASGF